MSSEVEREQLSLRLMILRSGAKGHSICASSLGSPMSVALLQLLIQRVHLQCQVFLLAITNTLTSPTPSIPIPSYSRLSLRSLLTISRICCRTIPIQNLCTQYAKV